MSNIHLDRYYASRIGRWHSKDPIGETETLNLYAFVKNMVSNANDLLGAMKNKKCHSGNNIQVCWGELESTDIDTGSGMPKRFPRRIYGFIATPPPPQFKCDCKCKNKTLKIGTYFLSQRKREYKSFKEWELDGEKLDYLDGGKHASIGYGNGAYVDTPGLDKLFGKDHWYFFKNVVYKMDFRIELWCRCPKDKGGEYFTGNALQFHFTRYYNKRGELYSSISLDFF